MKDRRIYNYLFTVSLNFAIIASIVLVSCENPSVIMEMEKIETPEIIYPETPIIIEKEEVKVMELKPIAEYDKYCVTDDLKVYGLKGKLKELIVLEDSENQLHPFNDFFVKDGKVYFSVKSIVNGDPIKDTDPVQYEAIEQIDYFSQGKGKITGLSKNTYPVKPESKRVEMGISPWSIVTGEYKGDPISAVRQVIDDKKKPVKNFLNVDAYFVANGCLWFSVSEGIKGAESGLWYWESGSGRLNHICSGKIW